jgi:hypothetical protein
MIEQGVNKAASVVRRMLRIMRSTRSSFFLYKFIRTLTLGSTLLFLTYAGIAQLVPVSPPIADPNDTRFQGVKEDWTSPSLAGSQLKPARPLEFVTDKPQYTLELLRLQWRWGDPIDVYVMKPNGVKKPPVILYLYGYPTNTNIFLNDDYQALVTKNGVAAVGFVSALTGHRYHDRPMKEWFLSELQESLATSAHDIQMVLNYLTTRGDLDMNRVGMFAQGSGASIAILASAVDPRIKVLEALDPWGDWPTWMATSPFVPEEERGDYVKPEFLKKIAPLDPVEWLPKIQAKRARLDRQVFDEVTPKAGADKLRAAAPAGTAVELYPTMKEFKAAFQEGNNLVWIQQALQSLPSELGVPKTLAPVERTPSSR